MSLAVCCLLSSLRLMPTRHTILPVVQCQLRIHLPVLRHIRLPFRHIRWEAIRLHQLNRLTCRLLLVTQHRLTIRHLRWDMTVAFRWFQAFRCTAHINANSLVIVEFQVWEITAWVNPDRGTKYKLLAGRLQASGRLVMPSVWAERYVKSCCFSFIFVIEVMCRCRAMGPSSHMLRSMLSKTLSCCEKQWKDLVSSCIETYPTRLRLFWSILFPVCWSYVALPIFAVLSAASYFLWLFYVSDVWVNWNKYLGKVCVILQVIYPAFILLCRHSSANAATLHVHLIGFAWVTRFVVALFLFFGRKSF